jgi:hypothetical protein
MIEKTFNLTVLLSIVLTEEEFNQLQHDQQFTDYGNRMFKLIKSKRKGVLSHPDVSKFWLEKNGIAYTAQLRPSNITLEFDFDKLVGEIDGK